MKMTHADWKAEAVRRFGSDPLNWKFVCPSCGYIASVKDWKDVGAAEGEIAFSCVGRHSRSAKQFGDRTGGPCNYAGGGLLRINPVEVEIPGALGTEGRVIQVFDFAPEISQEV